MKVEKCSQTDDNYISYSLIKNVEGVYLFKLDTLPLRNKGQAIYLMIGHDGGTSFSRFIYNETVGTLYTPDENGETLSAYQFRRVNKKICFELKD